MYFLGYHVQNFILNGSQGKPDLFDSVYLRTKAGT